MNKLEKENQVVGTGSFAHFTKEDFYAEIRAIRELMGNKDTFDADYLIEKAAFIYTSCTDQSIADTCLSLIEEIKRRAVMLGKIVKGL